MLIYLVDKINILRFYNQAGSDSHKLIRNAGIAVGEVDDATAGEAVLLEDVLHNEIVGMSICTERRGQRPGKIEGCAGNAVGFWRRCKAMNCCVRKGRREPLTTLNKGVCRVIAHYAGEGCDGNIPLIADDIAVGVTYVVFKHL